MKLIHTKNFIYDFSFIRNLNFLSYNNNLKMYYFYNFITLRYLRYGLKKQIYNFSNFSLAVDDPNFRNKSIFSNSFIGFKFRMAGRLSRKQRASSY